MFDSHPASDTPHHDLQDTDTEPQTRFQHRERLAREITTLAGHLNAGNYRFLKLLEEFDRDEGWGGAGIRSLAHWLNWQCGISHPVARENVRVARALPALPMIEDIDKNGRVAPGIAPPGLPQIRTCGTPASGSSSQGHDWVT